jgi:N6-adenosine-specific RNA methylase IME4
MKRESAVIARGNRIAVQAWAERITMAWRRSVDAILETGRLLIAAKEALPHGEWLPMIQERLPFGPRTSQKLMKIAADQRLAKAAHGALLPPHWRTLYELTRLPDAQFEAALKSGAIRADMERGDVAAIVQAERRAAFRLRTEDGCTVDDLRALAASGRTFGAILADPGWLFQSYSEKGEGRSAGQHYTTTPFDAIKAWPVGALAAKDCALFLWQVDWAPLMAHALIEAWGFRHKTTAFTWIKTTEGGGGWHIGQGYWTRANPEVCLLSTRGQPRRIHADVRQLLIAPVGEHSAKPEETNARIEALVPGPYLELNARRERKGWTVWGDEIKRAALAAGAGA